jgi:protein O-GlcNAc transferase
MPQLSLDQAMNTAAQHCEAGRLADAQNICHQILAQSPRHADALYLLGVIASQLGKTDNAIEFIDQAIGINPTNAQYHFALGALLSERGRPAAAIAAYRKAVQLKPDFSQAYTNLSFSLRQNQQIEEAIAAARIGVQLQPGAAFPLINLGTALHSARRLPEAIAVFRQAIQLQPNYALAHNNLGNLLKEQGELEEAIAELRHAVQLEPTAPRFHSNLLYSLHSHPDYNPAQIYQEALRWSAQHTDSLSAAIRSHTNDPSPDRKLKIGYVSPDFREHSVARFLLPLLSHHDRAQFEIHCFSTVLFADQTTAQFREIADRWHEVGGLKEEQLAELIHREQIDILVDLAGHTAGHRLMTFARKPAPIQIAWLGYPGTTGLRTIDYRLTDAIADPPGPTDSLHTEQLIRLPQTAWCYSPQPNLVLPPRNIRDENEPITFGSFNNISKVNSYVLALWCSILQKVPNSKLLLKAVGLGSSAIQDRLRKTFHLAGIAPDRLDLRGSALHIAEHLSMYNDMDIALDTFPYNGTTTTCEALWMGVPVISLAGQTHVSRVGASLLSSARLPELLAANPDDYIQIAVALANDNPRLQELHSTLRQRMEQSPLMDATHFTRNIEAAYRQAWRQWCTMNAHQ